MLHLAEGEPCGVQMASGQGQYAFGGPAPAGAAFGAQPAGAFNLGQPQ